MWIVFHASHVTRRMFKIMDFAPVALFDDLLPSAGEQVPEISMHCWITHRVFHGAASGWHPSTGDRARGIHVCVYVERHCHPWLQEFTSLLVQCLRFSEASNARGQARQTAGAERTLFAVACTPLFGQALRTARRCLAQRTPHNHQGLQRCREVLPSLGVLGYQTPATLHGPRPPKAFVGTEMGYSSVSSGTCSSS